MEGTIKKKRIRYLAYTLIVLGVVSLVSSSLTLYILKDTAKRTTSGYTNKGQERSESKENTYSTEVSYVVAPDRPKFLSISKLGIENARIVALGLKDNNQIRNPDNIRDVGWYAGSKKPGEKGAVFVYGHLSDTTQDGIFIRLHELDPGDSIVVTLGDNSQLTYLVKEQRRYQTDAVDMDSVLRSIDGYDEGLQLMTCAGSYDKNIDEFSERLVVFAVRK